MEASPVYIDRLWASYAPRSFAQFLEPWELPPPRPDGSRPHAGGRGAPDVEMASFALIEARGGGRMPFGGFFPDGASLAVMTVADPAGAIAPLDASGLFTAGSLRARPLLHIV